MYLVFVLSLLPFFFKKLLHFLFIMNFLCCFISSSSVSLGLIEFFKFPFFPCESFDRSFQFFTVRLQETSSVVRYNSATALCVSFCQTSPVFHSFYSQCLTNVQHLVVTSKPLLSVYWIVRMLYFELPSYPNLVPVCGMLSHVGLRSCVAVGRPFTWKWAKDSSCFTSLLRGWDVSV